MAFSIKRINAILYEEVLPMKKRILFINPVASSDYNDQIKDYLEAEKCLDTKIKVVSLKKGPLHLDYNYYETLVLTPILQIVKQAEQEGYNAVIIGCFLDPGLEAAREITNKLIIVAPAESCMNIAASLGDSFSFFVTRDKAIGKCRHNVLAHGFKDRLASIKSIGLGVNDLQNNKIKTLEKLKTLAKEAVEKDLAEVIILGCTFQFGFYKELQDYVGVPVLDGILASLKYAELLIELKSRFNWGHSKVYGYQSPPDEEMIKWKLDEHFEAKGI
jgi:allantoin racemase